MSLIPHIYLRCITVGHSSIDINELIVTADIKLREEIWGRDTEVRIPTPKIIVKALGISEIV